MNNTGINTSVYANVVAPFSPVGRQAIGLETAEAKEDVFPPVEESAATDAATNSDSEANELARTSQREAEQRVEQRQQQQQQLEEQQVIRQLAARDREVRAHEQAHAAVGGQYAGAPSVTFERGPDGVNYAVGGEVPITLPSGGDDPRQTLAAAEQVRRAALAPAEPSAQDRRVAAEAARVAVEARADIVELQARERRLEAERVEQASQEEQQTEQIEAPVQQQAQQGQDDPGQSSSQSQEAISRSIQLSEQLATLDNIQSNQNVGLVVDQRA